MSTTSDLQIDVALYSIFASRKRVLGEEEKQSQVASVLPSNFQVYAKIEEESRKDSQLTTSFLLTLNDVRASVTYEFRGSCNISGSSADFESVMEASKDSRVPRILDVIYQRLYPVVFMLAGMTTSSYPQSIALLTEMVSTEPVHVHQEAEALPKPEEKPRVAEKPEEKPRVAEKPEEKPRVAEKPEEKPRVAEKLVIEPKAMPRASVPAPKPTIAKKMKKTQSSLGDDDLPL